MARVNEGWHSFTCHPHIYPHMKWTILPLLPSHRASPHFSWYSFPIPYRVGGWVGLGGSVKYWGGLPTWRRCLCVHACVLYCCISRLVPRRCDRLTSQRSRRHCELYSAGERSLAPSDLTHTTHTAISEFYTLQFWQCVLWYCSIM